MSVRSRSVIPIAIIVASVALALSFVGSPSISSVAMAAEEIPAIAQAAVAELNDQPRGDESQPQVMNDDGDSWNGWWVIMPIMMVLFWGGVLGVAVWGIRQFTKDRGRGGSPLDIAKERLARGEIGKDEFDRIKGDLV